MDFYSFIAEQNPANGTRLARAAWEGKQWATWPLALGSGHETISNKLTTDSGLVAWPEVNFDLASTDWVVLE